MTDTHTLITVTVHLSKTVTGTLIYTRIYTLTETDTHLLNTHDHADIHAGRMLLTRQNNLTSQKHNEKPLHRLIMFQQH